MGLYSWIGHHVHFWFELLPVFSTNFLSTFGEARFSLICHFVQKTSEKNEQERTKTSYFIQRGLDLVKSHESCSLKLDH